MKKIKFLFAVVAVMGFTADAFAQQSSTASANTSATIIQPIAITKTTDLNFGNIAVHSTNNGTVVLGTSNNRSQTGGVTLPVATPGTVTSASFDVTGAAGYTYSITLPTSVILDDNNSHQMTVNTFTSNPSTSGTLDVNGEDVISVGATLNVLGGQAPGLYESDSDFDVIVNYN